MAGISASPSCLGRIALCSAEPERRAQGRPDGVFRLKIIHPEGQAGLDDPSDRVPRGAQPQ
jgi:hypothetical protein